MAFSPIPFLSSHGIRYWIEGKNVSPGWTNIRCPLCGDHSNHGGFNPEGNFYSCWKCGVHSIPKVIAALLKIPLREARQEMEKFQFSFLLRARIKKASKVEPENFTIPGGSLSPFHIKYLKSRGLDPEYLALQYGIRGTGIAERWNNIDFSLRIIIPILDRDKKIVSFHSRAISSKIEPRYKGCPISLSPKPMKSTLYNLPFATAPDVIVVEGIFDAWKMGKGVVATYGTTVTDAQIQLLSKFRRVFFLFDDEPEAQEQAQEAAGRLSALRGGSVEVIRYRGRKDPGDLTMQEAEELKREILE